MKYIALAVALSVTLVACGESANEEYNDSGKLNNHAMPAARIAFPDGFGNLAAKCFGTDMVYSAKNDNGRAVAVSPGHPWCEDGTLTNEEMDR